MNNQEKQADEILVLQSIFDKNFHLLDDNNQYEILIDFEFLQSIEIIYNNNKSMIKYLPPFSLIIHYHDEYPSDEPPSFILSCFYFSKYNLEKLCQKLDNYKFNNDVCVYQWIDLIKQEINDKIIFNNEVFEQKTDPRALNGYTNNNIEQIFQYLINYNNEYEYKKFQKQLQICLICTDSIPGIDCICLYRCRHFYCKNCLNNYVQMTLNNGQFGEKIRCPQNDCQQSLLPTEIKQILQNEQLYEKYERLTFQHGLELMNDILWCPR